MSLNGNATDSSSSTSSMTENSDGQKQNNEWFHGVLQRQDADELLVKPGSFLLRASEVHGEANN